jgi:hypothetical protein
VDHHPDTIALRTRIDGVGKVGLALCADVVLMLFQDAWGMMKTTAEIVSELRAQLGRLPSGDEVEARRRELMKQWYADMALSARTLPDAQR